MHVVTNMPYQWWHAGLEPWGAHEKSRDAALGQARRDLLEDSPPIA